MKKKLTTLLLIIAVLMALPMTARADMGPKPSVNVDFTGLDDGSVYYATLLSEQSSTGPSSAWEGDGSYCPYESSDPLYPIWEKFVGYDDPDGFYFLQEIWDCTESSRLDWTYYPPHTFKVLIYFPDSGAFYSTGIYDRYAFDSYYTVDLSNLEPDVELTARKSYDYTWEIISLLARIVITILLELAVALIFGYRGRKLFLFLTAVNIFTQAFLNILLNLTNYYSGQLAFIAVYMLAELAIFIIESILYAKRLHQYSGSPKSSGRAVLYALVANTVSLGAGFSLARLIPGIF